MKKFAIILAVIVVAAFGLGFVAMHFINGEMIAGKARAFSSKAVGEPIEFKEEPTIAFFPPVITFGDFSWNFKMRNYQVKLSAKKMRAELDPFALLGGNVAFREIYLEKPQASCEEIAGVPHENGHGMPPSGHELLPPQLERLMIGDGKLHYSSGDFSALLEGINFSVENIKSSHEADVKSDGILTITAGPVKNTLAGNAAFRGKLRYYAPNMTFRQCAFSFTPTSGILPHSLAPLQASLEGGINLENLAVKVSDMEISSPQGRISLKGDGNIFPAAFKGRCDLEMDMNRCVAFLGGDIVFEKNPPVLLSGELDLDQKGFIFENLAIKLDEAEGSGSLGVHYPHANNPAGITGRLHFGRIPLNNLLSAHLVEKEKKNDAGAAVPEQAYPDVDLNLDAVGINYQKMHSGKLSLELLGNKGVYKLRNFALAWAGGNITANTSANFITNDANINLKGSKLDLAEVLGQLGTDAIEKGTADFEAQINGSMGGNILASLAGSGNATVKNMKISILGALRTLMPLLGKKDMLFAENIESAEAKFTMKNGLMDVRPVSMKARDLAADGHAIINLDNKYLDCSLEVKALGLNLPLTFKGPFSNVELDVQSRFLPDIKLKMN